MAESAAMPLGAGTRIGVYEVVGVLGAGGMGEVYRARDTRLKREVALKILPPSFATDPDRLARFQREAEVLASLNHPNIAAIYGLEDTDGVRALIMELVEGETLADRIARGAIAVEEALPIAKQIAEALEAAHEQGIIHRDLKPANIKVKPDGTVKVLDFGLAKLAEAGEAGRVDEAGGDALSLSPTITSPALMTGVGVLLGTAAYMSPEQAKGRPADKRSDIWAFGCVLYEMLTGQRTFEGDDVTDTLANVLKMQPDWGALPPDVPDSIETLVRRCLEKDRARRVVDLSIALFIINEFSIDRSKTKQVDAAVSPPSSRWLRAALLAVAALVIAVIGLVWWRAMPAESPPAAVTRFSITLSPDQQFTSSNRMVIALSPDGRTVVGAANRRLYARSMSSGDVKAIAGSDGAGPLNNPVFSPDGQWIAYWDAGDRRLKKIRATGGTPVEICESTNPAGLDWSGDDIWIGGFQSGVLRVSANGGKAELIIRVKEGERAWGPQLLPDGNSVLFTVGHGTDPSDDDQVVVQSTEGGERTTLIERGSGARYYEPTGHLLYAVGGVLFAAAYDPRGRRLDRGAVPVVEGVLRGMTAAPGMAEFNVSTSGTLIYLPGPSSSSLESFGVALINRNGDTRRLNIPPGPYEFPRISPDGKWLAVESDDGKSANIWIYDLAGTSAIRQLTFGGRNQFPVWSADSLRVAFQSDREGDSAIFWQRMDGTGSAERLSRPESGVVHVPESSSPDGQHLLFDAIKEGSHVLWMLSLSDKRALPFADVRSRSPIAASFSPDGRWIAYTSQSAGGAAGAALPLFVQPFPATGAKYLVANGNHPFWSPDGRELFFNPGAAQTYDVVRIATQPRFAFNDQAPVPGLTAFRPRSGNYETEVGMSPDGRFVGIVAARSIPSDAGATPPIEVVLNWDQELKRLVPAK